MNFFLSKCKNFHSRKCIWKYSLWNGGHFVQGKCVNNLTKKRIIDNNTTGNVILSSRINLARLDALKRKGRFDNVLRHWLHRKKISTNDNSVSSIGNYIASKIVQQLEISKPWSHNCDITHDLTRRRRWSCFVNKLISRLYIIVK